MSASENPARMRVCFLARALVPFHRPITDEIAGMCDLRVRYLSTKRPFEDRIVEGNSLPPYVSTSRSWNIQLDRGDLAVQISLGVSRWLSDQQPDVVIVHSYIPSMWEAIVWARRNGVPIVMWSESTPSSGRVRGRLSQKARTAVFRRIDRFVSNGSRATDLLTLHGIPKSRISQSCYPIDAREIIGMAEAGVARRDDADRTLRLLLVGRLIPSKRASDLIHSVRMMQNDSLVETIPVAVRIVGEGPELESLRRSAGGLPIEFLGRLEGASLARQYVWADVLVMPSEREVWGLVVNEALAAGLFVVASSQVESAVDLLGSPLAGEVYPMGSVSRLSRTLLDLADSLDVSAAARQRRRDLARQAGAFSPSSFASALVSSARAALLEKGSGH